jgi:cobalt-zinc-cadmium efflux system outer membrane protein
MTQLRRTALILVVLTVAGCNSSPPNIPLPEPRPLGSDIPAYRAPESPEPEAPVFVAPEGVLTLRDAMAAALLGSPDLATSSHEVRAAEARELQASLLPNPEMEIEMEEFGGTGDAKGFDVFEVSLGLSQEILLGAKISKRTAVANLEGRLAGWSYEAARLDVLTESTHAFVAVLAAQERVKVLTESVRLSENATRSVKEQVSAGKVPRLEENRAAVNQALQQLALQRATRGLAIERQALTATWGGTVVAYQDLTGDFYAIRPVPTPDAFSAFLVDNPELARRAVETELARAKIALEKAGAIPDITVAGGVRRFNEGNVVAFFVGIEFPLPVFDRNQGSVREAHAEAEKTREEQRAALARLTRDLNTAWQILAVAASEASILKDRVVPLAQGAFDAAGEGFRQGKFAYLEVLDAQRTLFETREQLVDALAAYHTAVADVERLIGRSLVNIADATDREDEQSPGHPEGED